MSYSQGRSDKQLYAHNSRFPSFFECAAESFANVIVSDNSDEGESDALLGTVVVEDQDVERDLTPWEPMKNERKLGGVSEATPLLPVL